MIKLQKISRKQIIGFADADYQISLQDDELSEMAIPSYLHPLPMVRWLMWRRYETIADWLDLGPNSRVLEFGCGTGVFLPTLCSNDSTVYALDLAPEIAKKLCFENRLPVNFIEELNQIEDGSLDVVVAADVLEHIEDINATITGLQKKIKPGGRLLVSGPTENIAYKMMRIVVGFEGKGDYHFSNINLLIPIISNSGFGIVRQKILPYTFAPPLFQVVDFIKLQ